MSAYYNEIDPYCAEWLRNLIREGHIAPGDVDERDIREVQPPDLRGYTQCHFFAGIAGWSLALRLAGWPDDRPVWTGSCPCQPFSAAGKGKAADDERHLWPVWFPLIAERRPATVFGEQVEAAVGWGWLDAVFSDLETEGYACGASVLPACSVGAPHIRQRLWFVANASGQFLRSGCGDDREASPVLQSEAHERQRLRSDNSTGGATSELANAKSLNWEISISERRQDKAISESGRPSRVGELADTDGGHASAARRQRGGQHGLEPQDGGAVAVADTECDPSDAGRLAVEPGEGAATASARASTESRRCGVSGELGHPASNGERGPRVAETGDRWSGEARGSSAWSDCEWLPCTDGKQRPTQPGIFPLAHGLRNRVAQLRAAGNAIVPQVAAQFIKACT